MDAWSLFFQRRPHTEQIKVFKTIKEYSNYLSDH